MNSAEVSPEEEDNGPVRRRRRRISSSSPDDNNEEEVEYDDVTIPEGLECLVTMEDITVENYVEYQIYPSMKWKTCYMEQCVVEELLATQFTRYVSQVRAADCQAELSRLLSQGPPIYISDPIGLPLRSDDDDDDDDTKVEAEEGRHVHALWYSSDEQIRSAKLNGAVEGAERQKLWEELKEFTIISEGNNNESE